MDNRGQDYLPRLFLLKYGAGNLLFLTCLTPLVSASVSIAQQTRKIAKTSKNRTFITE